MGFIFKILGGGHSTGGSFDQTDSKTAIGATGEELANSRGLGRRDEVSESSSRQAAIDFCRGFLENQKRIDNGPRMGYFDGNFLYKF